MKKFLFVVAILSVFGALALASDARVAGMGIPVWLVPSDDSLVNYFPAQVVNHYDEINFNSNTEINADVLDIMLAGSTTSIFQIVKSLLPSDGGYATLKVGGGVLGVLALPYTGILKSAPRPLPFGGGLLDDTFVTSDVTEQNPFLILAPDRSYGLIYGLNLSDSISAALSAGIADAGQTNNMASTEALSDSSKFSSKSMAINIGAGANVSKMIDVGINLSLPTVENSGKYIDGVTGFVTDQEIVKSDSGFDMNATARATISPLTVAVNFQTKSMQITDKQMEDNSLVPNNSFTDIGDTNNQEVDSKSMTMINGGISGNFEVNKKVTFFPGIAVKYSSTIAKASESEMNLLIPLQDQNEMTMTDLSVPIFIAAEGSVNENIVVRAGISKNLISTTQAKIKNLINGGVPVTPEETMTVDLSDTNSVKISGGVTIVVGDAKIDLTMTGGINAENVPEVGGLSLKMPGSIASQISATYQF